ncbi:MAG: Gfo/Idh/MocA family oxidoreductase [Spirochaetales bacterium]|jgi:scyllo-inositol 2-dehydrogenase (NADP+)|nr:Gfo/Idh/MocA family oxidoreductase [Spirochaetales bacterium]
MKILRTAVAGLGRIGWKYHLPSVAKHPGFELIAAADTDADRIAETKAEYGAAPYDNVEQMLDSEKPDLLVICTPTHLHAAHSQAAFDRGIDVFLDKPVAGTAEEAYRILDASEKAGRKLMMYQPWRLRRETLAIKEILSSGRLGDLFMIRLYTGTFVRRNDWQALTKYGGGMLNNSGAHLLDLLVYLTGTGSWKLFSRLLNIASTGDAEDVVKVSAQTEQGLLIDLEINSANALPGLRWTLLGNRGTAAFEENNLGPGEFRIRYFVDEDQKPAVLNDALAAANREYMNREEIVWRETEVDLADIPDLDYYDHCHAYFAADELPFVPLSQTRQVIKLMELCRESNSSQEN